MQHKRGGIRQKTPELSKWLWITLLHISTMLRGRIVPTVYGQKDAVPTGKDQCPSYSVPALACLLASGGSDTRQAVPGAPQSKARLNQAGTDLFFFSLFFLSPCAI